MLSAGAVHLLVGCDLLKGYQEQECTSGVGNHDCTAPPLECKFWSHKVDCRGLGILIDQISFIFSISLYQVIIYTILCRNWMRFVVQILMY